jgi:hypothetical protein
MLSDALRWALALQSAVYNIAVQKYLCIGYDCVCGERVEVLRWLQGEDSFPAIPPAITVCCRRGHVATMSAEMFAIMEQWEVEEG